MSPSDAPESVEPYWATASFFFGDFERLDRKLDAPVLRSYW
jgi:hypothetical protein